MITDLSKTFEKIITNRLLQYTLQNGIIKEYQTAFRPHKDTTENILHILQTITNNFNLNRHAVTISLDIKQAFDRVWHHKILHILNFQTSTHLAKLINSFLTNRQISIKADNTLSNISITPIHGLPQGSPLSPILFNILLSTAPTAHVPNIHHYNYADDTFFLSTADTPKQAWRNIKPHIQNFTTWCHQNRLAIETNKTNITFFTRRRAPPPNFYPTCTINNTIIPRQTQTKILGVTFDIHLTMKQHIDNINSGTHYTINKIRKLFSHNKIIPPYIGIILYNTLIRTKFTYAAPTLLIIKDTTWKQLEYTEHRALRAAQHKGIRTRISTLYSRSHIQPLREHYRKVSKNTLLRYIRNNNIRLLKTITECKRHRHQHIAYWHPPLNQTYDLLSPQEKQLFNHALQLSTSRTT